MSQALHPALIEVTQRIVARSATSRSAYLRRLQEAVASAPARRTLGCGNLAHATSRVFDGGGLAAARRDRPNVAIVIAYNDMFSAHQPFSTYPAVLRRAVLRAGGVAQLAGGEPAMCDGVTQAGMEPCPICHASAGPGSHAIRFLATETGARSRSSRAAAALRPVQRPPEAASILRSRDAWRII